VASDVKAIRLRNSFCRGRIFLTGTFLGEVPEEANR
jgi:hypothetical protein